MEFRCNMLLVIFLCISFVLKASESSDANSIPLVTLLDISSVATSMRHFELGSVDNLEWSSADDMPQKDALSKKRVGFYPSARCLGEQETISRGVLTQIWIEQLEHEDYLVGVEDKEPKGFDLVDLEDCADAGNAVRGNLKKCKRKSKVAQGQKFKKKEVSVDKEDVTVSTVEENCCCNCIAKILYIVTCRSCCNKCSC